MSVEYIKELLSKQPKHRPEFQKHPTGWQTNGEMPYLQPGDGEMTQRGSQRSYIPTAITLEVREQSVTVDGYSTVSMNSAMNQSFSSFVVCTLCASFFFASVFKNP